MSLAAVIIREITQANSLVLGTLMILQLVMAFHTSPVISRLNYTKQRLINLTI